MRSSDCHPTLHAITLRSFLFLPHLHLSARLSLSVMARCQLTWAQRCCWTRRNWPGYRSAPSSWAWRRASREICTVRPASITSGSFMTARTWKPRSTVSSVQVRCLMRCNRWKQIHIFVSESFSTERLQSKPLLLVVGSECDVLRYWSVCWCVSVCVLLQCWRSSAASWWWRSLGGWWIWRLWWPCREAGRWRSSSRRNSSEKLHTPRKSNSGMYADPVCVCVCVRVSLWVCARFDKCEPSVPLPCFTLIFLKLIFFNNSRVTFRQR